MLTFLRDNLPTILVGAVVFSAVGAAVWKIISDKLHHRSSCGCSTGCGGCSSAKTQSHCSCHEEAPSKET